MGTTAPDGRPERIKARLRELVEISGHSMRSLSLWAGLSRGTMREVHRTGVTKTPTLHAIERLFGLPAGAMSVDSWVPPARSHLLKHIGAAQRRAEGPPSAA